MSLLVILLIVLVVLALGAAPVWPNGGPLNAGWAPSGVLGLVLVVVVVLLLLGRL